jgi:hypothetical protein
MQRALFTLRTEDDSPVLPDTGIINIAIIQPRTAGRLLLGRQS